MKQEENDIKSDTSFRQTRCPHGWVDGKQCEACATESRLNYVLEKDRQKKREINALSGAGRDEMDQCKHCLMRGDLKRCMETTCNQHESWMVGELRKLLDHAVKQADGWYDDCHGGPIDDDPLMDAARSVLAPNSSISCQK